MYPSVQSWEIPDTSVQQQNKDNTADGERHQLSCSGKTWRRCPPGHAQRHDPRRTEILWRQVSGTSTGGQQMANVHLLLISSLI